MKVKEFLTKPKHFTCFCDIKMAIKEGDTYSNCPFCHMLVSYYSRNNDYDFGFVKFDAYPYVIYIYKSAIIIYKDREIILEINFESAKCEHELQYFNKDWVENLLVFK